MSRAKDKGTAAETAVVKALRASYWPHAERRALKGGKDCGDTTGHPGLVFEVKAVVSWTIPSWLRETEAERVNDGADYGILVFKPRRVGHKNVSKWYAVMRYGPHQKLVEQAGGPSMFQVQYRGTPLRPDYWLPEARGGQDGVGAQFSRVVVWPINIAEDDKDNWHAYMYLDHMLDLLHMAGYGSTPQGEREGT